MLDESRVWHEMGYRVGEHWLQPGVSVIWPGQELQDGWYRGAPMVAVEVISSSAEAERMMQR